MYHSQRRGVREKRPVTIIDLVCVALVVIAIATLVGFVVTQAGGGHLPL